MFPNFSDKYTEERLLRHIVTLNFLKNRHVISHSGCASLHSHQQWMRVPFSPQPVQHLLPDLWMTAILTGVIQYLTVVLVCIPLIASEVKHLLIDLLAICMSSCERCLFRSSAHFLFESFVCLILTWMSSLYILDINPLLELFANTISLHSGKKCLRSPSFQGCRKCTLQPNRKGEGSGALWGSRKLARPRGFVSLSGTLVANDWGLTSVLCPYPGHWAQCCSFTHSCRNAHQTSLLLLSWRVCLTPAASSRLQGCICAWSQLFSLPASPVRSHLPTCPPLNVSIHRSLRCTCVYRAEKFLLNFNCSNCWNVKGRGQGISHTATPLMLLTERFFLIY